MPTDELFLDSDQYSEADENLIAGQSYHAQQLLRALERKITNKASALLAQRAAQKEDSGSKVIFTALFELCVYELWSSRMPFLQVYHNLLLTLTRSTFVSNGTDKICVGIVKKYFLIICLKFKVAIILLEFRCLSKFTNILLEIISCFIIYHNGVLIYHNGSIIFCYFIFLFLLKK